MADQPDLSVVEPPSGDEIVPLADPDLFPQVVEPEEVEEDPEDVARRARQEETDRAVRHRAELYVEMAKTHAFKEFLGELARKEAQMRAAFAADLLRDPVPGKVPPPVDQRRTDYDLGFINGMGFVTKTIEGAERHLKKLDEKAAAAASEPDDDEGRFEF